MFALTLDSRLVQKTCEDRRLENRYFKGRSRYLSAISYTKNVRWVEELLILESTSSL